MSSLADLKELFRQTQDVSYAYSTDEPGLQAEYLFLLRLQAKDAASPVAILHDGSALGQEADVRNFLLRAAHVVLQHPEDLHLRQLFRQLNITTDLRASTVIMYHDHEPHPSEDSWSMKGIFRVVFARPKFSVDGKHQPARAQIPLKFLHASDLVLMSSDTEHEIKIIKNRATGDTTTILLPEATLPQSDSQHTENLRALFAEREVYLEQLARRAVSRL